jgi:hypothetical protein
MQQFGDGTVVEAVGSHVYYYHPSSLMLPPFDPTNVFFAQLAVAADQRAFACWQQYTAQQETLSRLGTELVSMHALCAERADIHAAAVSLHQQAIALLVSEHQTREQTMRDEFAADTAIMKEKLAAMTVIATDAKIASKKQQVMLAEQLASTDKTKRQLATARKQLADAQDRHETKLIVLHKELALSKEADARMDRLEVELATRTINEEKTARVLKIAHINCNTTRAQLHEMEKRLVGMTADRDTCSARLHDAKQRIDGIISLQSHIADNLAKCIAAWEDKLHRMSKTSEASPRHEEDSSTLRTQVKLVFEFAVFVMHQFVVHVLKDDDDIRRMQHAMTVIQAQISRRCQEPLQRHTVDEIQSVTDEEQANVNVLTALVAITSIAKDVAI